MTKEFNRQRSNGPRPPLRHTSSNRFEGSSPRSARLRLSRDVVDRAWENGAQNRHADYHPRPNHKNSPANGRNSQHGGYQQRNRFGNNQGGQPDTSSQQPFEPGKRRYNRGTPGTQNDGRYRAPARGNYRSDFVDRNRPPYDRPTGEHRGKPPYDRSAGEQRGYNTYRRENHRYRDHGSYQERAPRRAYATEQYEGDYEQFNYSEDTFPPRGNRGKSPASRSTPAEERHVTRLPDGRVLKGSRPQQRHQARFWADIAEDTQELLEPTQEPESQPEPVNSNHTTRKQRAKSAARKRDRTVQQTGGNIPRPSQKGFKWPTT